MGKKQLLFDQETIHSRLTETYLKSQFVEIEDPGKLKIIVFSDHHRGVKDRADDFLKCKRAYHAALGWYLEGGFQLVLLGDVEDLWESKPGQVCEAYRDTLELEQRFAMEKKLIRIAGNHDEEWLDAGSVRKHIGKYLNLPETFSGFPLSHLIRIKTADGKNHGEIFFAHGYQGTFDSEQISWLSKLFVRYILRPLQRLTNFRSTTPSNDFEMRNAHEIIMHNWAATKERFIFITGHTHHPVFDSVTHEALLREELAQAQTIEKKAVARAKLEWVLVASEGVESSLPVDKSGFFNAGCCSFSDGDITGIEIENGEIRLVRWPDDTGSPLRKILASGKLSKVFDRI
jgi:UDP-2,3-diacylglucosamine pyrophosphatase LpxH